MLKDFYTKRKSVPSFDLKGNLQNSIIKKIEIKSPEISKADYLEKLYLNLASNNIPTFDLADLDKFKQVNKKVKAENIKQNNLEIKKKIVNLKQNNHPVFKIESSEIPKENRNLLGKVNKELKKDNNTFEDNVLDNVIDTEDFNDGAITTDTI